MTPPPDPTGSATAPSVQVRLGPLRLANPVIAASSEFTMTEAGIRACVDAGAGAVVAKSINEDPAAARQLDIAEYVLLDDDHALRPWRDAQLSDSLFNRSGLAQTGVEDWMALLERCDRHARQRGSMVIGSITVSGPEPAGRLARLMAEVVGCVELNLSAPHGKEAAGGAVRQVGTAEGVAEYTRAVRSQTDVPLIVKLTAQTTDVAELATAAVGAGADVVAMIGRFQGFLPDLDGEPVLGSAGGIGGRWALPVSLYWIRRCHLALPDTPLIGTNGARDGGDVLRFLLSGASAVEMATAVLLHGPQVLTDAVITVQDHLSRHGLADLRPLVGSAARTALTYAELMAKVDRPAGRFPWQSPA